MISRFWNQKSHHVVNFMNRRQCFGDQPCSQGKLLLRATSDETRAVYKNASKVLHRGTYIIHPTTERCYPENGTFTAHCLQGKYDYNRNSSSCQVGNLKIWYVALYRMKCQGRLFLSMRYFCPILLQCWLGPAFTSLDEQRLISSPFDGIVPWIDIHLGCPAIDGSYVYLFEGSIAPSWVWQAFWSSVTP